MSTGWLAAIRQALRGKPKLANLVSTPEWHAAVKARGQHPAFADWVGVFSVDRKGTAYFAEYLDLRDQVVITDARERHVVLWQAALRDPDLEDLRPVRGPDSVTCDQCEGTGRPKFSFDLPDDQASKFICQCGGAGWLPPGRSPDVPTGT